MLFVYAVAVLVQTVFKAIYLFREFRNRLKQQDGQEASWSANAHAIELSISDTLFKGALRINLLSKKIQYREENEIEEDSSADRR